MECSADKPSQFEILLSRTSDASYALVGFSVMIFDKTDMEAILLVTLEHQYIPFVVNSTMNYLEKTNFNIVMERHSAFVGLSGFKYSGVPRITFDTKMNYTNQSFKLFNSSSSMNYFDHFYYFNMNEPILGCSFNYPYQLGVDTNGLCFIDIPLGYYYNSTLKLLQPSFCPDGQYINSTDILCYPCKITCKTCVIDINCSTCNASNFRVFNNLTGQCDPLPGYYESGAKAALPCSIGCFSCINNSVCLECFNGTNRALTNGSCEAINGFYTINGTVNALPCSSTCLTCVNTQYFCLSCNSSLNRVLNSSTATCDPLPGYYEAGIDSALPCSIGCFSCINNSVCLECFNGTNRALTNGSCEAINGFYTINGTVNALPCSSTCLTCVTLN